MKKEGRPLGLIENTRTIGDQKKDDEKDEVIYDYIIIISNYLKS